MIFFIKFRFFQDRFIESRRNKWRNSRDVNRFIFTFVFFSLVWVNSRFFGWTVWKHIDKKISYSCWLLIFPTQFIDKWKKVPYYIFIMMHLDTNIFLFLLSILFFWFSFSFSFYLMIKRHVTLQSHDMSHDMMS